MKLRTVFMVAILCVALLFTATGCKKVKQLSPEQVRDEMLAQYEKYCEAVSNASDLIIEAAYTRSRVVGGERYTEQVTETIAYRGLGTENPASVVKQQVAFGPYSTQYAEYYSQKTAYCKTDNSTFRSNMDFQQFQSRHIPAIPIDAALYSTVEVAKNGDDTIATFSGPQKLEHWVTDYSGAGLVSASGTITVDKDGNVRNITYSAQYTCDTVTYDFQVLMSVKLETAQGMDEDFSGLSASGPLLSYFDAPRKILQVVGDVYTAQAMSAEYTETVHSDAFARSRSQVSTFDTYGTGEDFMAQSSYEVVNTDYSNTPVANSEVVVFKDGVCLSSLNGATPAVREGIQPETMRNYCEDAVLAALFTPNHFKNARLTTTKYHLRIDFDGNEEFANNLCSSIYAVFNADLDYYAESFVTPTASGYLCINKATGLPTYLGVSLERIHTIGEVDYPLTYQLKQTMQLSSTTAYQNIIDAIS